MKVYPKYKESGLSWVGAVPAHWNIVRTRVLLKPKKILLGKNENNLPMLSLTKAGIILRDVSSGRGKFSADESKFLIISPGDFVFCHFDVHETPRTVGLSEHHGYITGAYNSYEYQGKEPRYFYYLHEYYDDGKHLRGYYTGMRNTIKNDRFLSMPIALPPNEEQQSIVSYLDKKCSEIDALVAKRQQIIEKLRELRQVTIAQAVTKGLNPSAPMKDSGISWIGKVPEHWDSCSIPELLKVESILGSDADELLSVFLDRGVIRHSDSDGMQVHKPSKDMSNYQKVMPGNLVCNNQQAWRGSVGVSEYEGRISPAYFIFKLSTKLHTRYADYMFRSKSWNPAFVYSSKGVGSIQRNLYMPWFKQYRLIIPPYDEQTTISRHLDKKCAEIDTLISKHEQIIEKLKELKTSTIAHVVTGKVDVRDSI